MRSLTIHVLVAAGILTAAIAGPTSAADIVLKAPSPALTQSWQGFYFGPHLGYGLSRKKWIDNFPTFDGEVDADVMVDGAFGGFQVGYNLSYDWLLLGIEANVDWSAIGKKTFNCFSFGDQLCTSQPQWFGDLAARIGVIDGPRLFYVKGGLAWVHDRFTDYATCAGTQPIIKDGIPALCGDLLIANQARLGWLVGAGYEQFIARNWSVKFEYNYMDFGGRSVSFSDGGAGFFTEEIHQRMHVVKLGLH